MRLLFIFLLAFPISASQKREPQSYGPWHNAKLITLMRSTDPESESFWCLYESHELIEAKRIGSATWCAYHSPYGTQQQLDAHLFDVIKNAYLQKESNRTMLLSTAQDDVVYFISSGLLCLVCYTTNGCESWCTAKYSAS